MFSRSPRRRFRARYTWPWLDSGTHLSCRPPPERRPINTVLAPAKRRRHQKGGAIRARQKRSNLLHRAENQHDARSDRTTDAIVPQSGHHVGARPDGWRNHRRCDGEVSSRLADALKLPRRLSNPVLTFRTVTRSSSRTCSSLVCLLCTSFAVASVERIVRHLRTCFTV